MDDVRAPRHRGTVGLLLLALVLAATGCTLNKGTAFQQQFEPFLDDRDAIETRKVQGLNDLPGFGRATVDVVLRDDLDDDQIAEEIFQIAHHEVDDQVAYYLQVAFRTENGAGQTALTSVYVNVHTPMPDTADNRELLAERVERARAVAAADPGLVEFLTGPSLTFVNTTSDPLEIAPAIGAVLADAGELDRVWIAPGERRSAENRVELQRGADLASLDDLVATLEVVRQAAEVVRFVAVTASPDGEASLQVELATVPADPRPLLAAAAARDVTLVLPTPAPVPPDPAATDPAAPEGSPAS